ncbi:MAG: hypothetical protein OS112_04005 [Methanoregula sp.]|nr:MAG: hypothetical protein OS112_04005 [Methanoregula sp.]
MRSIRSGAAIFWLIGRQLISITTARYYSLKGESAILGHHSIPLELTL